MDSPLRVLHLEDNLSDTELVQATLEAEGIPSRLIRVENADGFVAALRKQDVDLVLADYTLPTFDGVSGLMLARRHAPDVPFIFVSGTLGEEVAIEALKLGATDYVLKTRLARLAPTVKRAMRELQHKAEQKRAEEALRRSEKELRDLVQTIPVMAFVIRADGSNEFASRRWVEFSGLSAEQSSGAGWVTTLHPDDREQHLAKWRASQANGQPFENEARHRDAHGKYRWLLVRAVPLRDDDGKILKWCGAALDVEDRKRAKALLAGEKRILEMVAKGDSLAEILDSLCRLVEEQARDVLASILLIEDDRLRHGGAPSLPKLYIEAIDGVVIGPCVGSCGTAAHRGEQVIVEDIANDPLWAAYRDAALSHSLRACWSTPIFSAEGKVIATFAMYYREPRSPTREDQKIIEQITHLAGIAIERKLVEKARRESEAYLAEAQRLSHSGSWAWAPATGKVRYWSDETYRVLGFDPHDGPASFEELSQRLEPEDQIRTRELVENAVRTKADFETAYRIIHPSGEVRNVHVVGHPVCDELGNLGEFVGTVVDVTERKHAEEALRASEQLARSHAEVLMRSLDVLATEPEPEKFIGELLRTIGQNLSATRLILWLRNPEDDSVRWHLAMEGDRRISPDPNHPLIADPHRWRKSAFFHEMLSTNSPAICEDVENETRIHPAFRQYLVDWGAKRFMTIPISMAGELRGFVGIHHAEKGMYRADEIELAQALAHHVMLAVCEQELVEQQRHAAILKERTRMARDIHDTLAQGFTGVILQMEATEEALLDEDPENAARHVRRARELARESLGEARRSVHALRPQALEQAGFADALRAMIKNTTAGTSLHGEFRLAGKPRELAPAIEENLLHITQEALANALKHAHAKIFETQLLFEKGGVRLELHDDGNGFVVDQTNDGGIGLIGMKERAEQIGAALTVTSKPGGGTSIIAVSPYVSR